MAVSTVVFTSQSVLLACFFDQFFRFVSDDPEIAAKAKEVMVIFILNIFPDCLVITLRGVAKALGIQHKLLNTHLFSQGILTTFFLWLFFDYGSYGIWISKLTISVYILIRYVIILR